MKTMHESDYSNSENSRRRHNTSCLRSAGYTSQLQAEEIQQLKDEIARLKGQKPKPKIKPSNLEKQTEERETKKTKKRRKKKKKTKHLEIAETIHLKPDNLPPRSRLKDYQE